MTRIVSIDRSHAQASVKLGVRFCECSKRKRLFSTSVSVCWLLLAAISLGRCGYCDSDVISSYELYCQRMSSRFVDGNKPQVYSCAATPTTSSSTGQAPAVDDKPVPVAMHGVLHMPGTASHGSSKFDLT